MKKIKTILIFLALIIALIISFNYIYKNTEPVFSYENAKKLPIIMYHHLIEDESKQNEFAISPKLFEKDLQFIKAQGFETITTNDLIDYVYKNKPLPEKPIMITFDDGHESFYAYAFPLLKKYNMKAVLSIVGDFTEKYSKNEDHNIKYSYLTWKQIKEMADSSYVQIANHTYNFHCMEKGRIGCSKKQNETKEQYKKAMEEDILKLQENITNYTGQTCNTFTYPFGKFSKETKEILKEFGFLAILNCAEKINIIDKNNPNFLLDLGRFNRPYKINTEHFFEKILKQM